MIDAEVLRSLEAIIPFFRGTSDGDGRDFRRQKLRLVVMIMVSGMAFNLIWYAVANYVLELPFPYNTFLFDGSMRFSDLADASLISRESNPYLFPPAFYMPFAWIAMRPFSEMNDSMRVALCFCFFTGILLMLLTYALRSIVPKGWSCAFLSLALIVLSYPILSCFDRGNSEIVLAALVAGCLYFFSKSKLIPATLCLVIAVGFKLYPVLLLALIARRNAKWALGALILAGILLVLALGFLPLAPAIFLEYYSRNMSFYNSYFVYQNSSLASSASLWNAGKLIYIFAERCYPVPAINFHFDNPVVHNLYAVYSGGILLLAVGIAGYAGFIEKEWKRGAAALLLLLSIAAPGGGDYRLMYTGIAAVLLILTTSHRSRDVMILVLLALIQVPKKFGVLEFAGYSGTGSRDVTTEVLIDPILIMVCLFLLVSSSLPYVKLHWTWLRIHRMIRQLTTF